MIKINLGRPPPSGIQLAKQRKTAKIMISLIKTTPPLIFLSTIVGVVVNKSTTLSKRNTFVHFSQICRFPLTHFLVVHDKDEIMVFLCERFRVCVVCFCFLKCPKIYHLLSKTCVTHVFLCPHDIIFTSKALSS